MAVADDSVIFLYQTTPHTIAIAISLPTYGLSFATQEHGLGVYAFFIQFILKAWPKLLPLYAFFIQFILKAWPKLFFL